MNFANYKKFIATGVLGFTLLFGTESAAQTREEKLAEAAKVFQQGSEALNQGTPESQKVALTRFQAALKIYSEASSKEDEANCLGWIGQTYLLLGNNQKALENYNRSQLLLKQLGNKSGESVAFACIGDVYARAGETKKALDAYRQSLQVLPRGSDDRAEATTNYKIGSLYLKLGDNQKAIAFLEHAALLWSLLPDERAELMTLNTIAGVRSLMGEKKQALESFNEALVIAKRLKDVRAEAEIVKQIGGLHHDLGDKQKAYEAYERARLLFKEIGDTKQEGLTLYFIGGTYSADGNNRKAIEYLNLALPIFHETRDTAMEALALYIVGAAHLKLGERQKAIDALNRALPIFEQLDNREFIGTTTQTLGEVYRASGENKKAADYFERSVSLFRQLPDPEAEARVLLMLGETKQVLGENKKALEYYDLARLLFKKLTNIGGEASALMGSGDVRHSLGENQRALESYEQALPLFLQVGDKRGQAMALRHIGEVYSDLEENQKALEFDEKALVLARELKDEDAEADTLNNIAGVYIDLGDFKSALTTLERSLALSKRAEDKRGQATMLGNMGVVYFRLGEWQKALEIYDQALPLARAVNDVEGEATIVDNIGQTNFALGRNETAFGSFEQALRLRREIGDKEGEAVTLSNMMTSSPFPAMAIYYGKQSINCFQELRRNIDGLDKRSQQTYLRSVEATYSALASLLILNHRLPEAHQVLNSFRDQQFFDFGKGPAKPLPIELTPIEKNFAARNESMIGRDRAIRKQLADLKDKAAGRELKDDEKTQIQRLENELKAATDAFTEFVVQSLNEFSKPIDEKALAGARDLTKMQSALGQISRSSGRNAVAAYQLLGQDNFHVLLITPDEIKGVSVPISKRLLNERAKQFWALLQSDKYDPRPLGKELYDVVFKSLEKELPGGTKTILWSLDGNLRYIPMAALFDGKQYMVERFDNINFTRADTERLTQVVSPKWNANAFGTATPHVVTNLGDAIRFAALPGVVREMSSIFSGPARVINSNVLLDGAFTQKTMLDRLRAKRPVVHIASHFSFRPGDESRSFLLLGDGTPFTLADMKKQTDMFAGVELLTLSACNTAAQQADASGREVDAFFELAQRLGAQSVLATLWPVADNSTPWLMREFYDLKVNGKQNKAEALRNAQLALLNGSAKAKRSAVRSNVSPVKIVVSDEASNVGRATRADEFIVEKKDAKPYIADRRRPFAHPFYWAPFVLIGNWR